MIRTLTPGTRTLKHLLPILLTLTLGPLVVSAVTPGDQARLADGLFARGFYEMALREYSGVIDQPEVKQRDVLLYRMAESQRELGRKAEAAATYDRVITGFPESVYAQRAALRQAETAVADARFDDAAAALRTRAEGSLEVSLRPAWRYYRALSENRRGQGKLAEPIYRRLLAEDGVSSYAPYAQLELADLVQARDPASAEIRTLLEAVVRTGRDTRTGHQAAARLAAHLYAQKDYPASADAYARVMQDDPAQAEAVRLYAAWAHFKAGRWSETISLVQPLNQADALYLRANGLRQLGKTEEARVAYAALIQQQPTNALAEAGRYEAAVLALQSGAFAEARALAAQVKPTAEVAEDLLWVQAEAARGAGQHADAITLYDQLAREQPRGLRSAAARFQAARLVQESGRWEEASNRYRELARDPMGRELAAEAWFASAYARIQIQQPTEAVSDWSVLIRDYPGFRALDEALYGHAQSESERGQGASARTSLERLLKDHPKSRLAPEAHYLLGTLLEAEDKWEGAEFHYRLAARENPDGALARRIEFRRVAVLQRQGRHEETASVLNGLLDAPAGSEGVPPALLDWLARWNLQQKDWAAAERAGLGLSKHGAAWTALGWFQVGVAREESGQRDSAREAYRKAAVDGASRESVESSYRLGRLATEAGDVAEAKASLSQAAERASKEEWADLRARSYLGLAHLAELGGDREEAARTFLSVALLYDDPTLTPEALFRAAQTLQALGRTVERDQTLKELRERYPETTWALRPLATP